MKPKSKQFKVDDKVFAKVKGYPAWPAIIMEKKSQRFIVKFYGTRETGSVKGEELFYYLKHRDHLIKGSKRKEFKDAIDEIEEAIAQAGGTDGSDKTVNEENVSGSKRKRRNSEKSTDSQATKKTEDSKSPESEQEDMSTVQDTDAQLDEDNRSLTDSNNIEEDLETPSNVQLISEKSLKHWIVYADYVKEHPTLYNTRSSYIRDYSPSQCLPVLLPTTKKYIGLKLHKQWPLQVFLNEYENALYDKEIAENLLKLKQRLQDNEINLDDLDKDLYLDDLNLTEDDIERDFEIKTFLNRHKLIERFQNESKLLDLDTLIRCSLKLEKAETEKAIDALKEMLAIEFYDEIMLKKHPHFIETIRRLRKYVGNIEDWNLSDVEKDNFNRNSRLIRELADDVYKKLKNVVKLPEDVTSFWEGFNNLAVKFKEDCAGLSNIEIFRLFDEPYSRASIIDRLQQKDLLESTDQQTEQAEHTVEKENSSEAANTENKTTDERDI